MYGFTEKIAKVCADTQYGNGVAFFGGFVCIFASVWAFAESYVAHNQSLPFGFSISVSQRKARKKENTH